MNAATDEQYDGDENPIITILKVRKNWTRNKLLGRVGAWTSVDPDVALNDALRTGAIKMVGKGRLPAFDVFALAC